MLLAAVALGSLAFAGTSRADVISDVNSQLLNIIANTSPALIDGPPNVAREIAMVNGAMYDAVNAASGGTGSTPYQFYSGGAVTNASAQAAALSAAYTMMNSLYGSGSLYQQLAGVTGATYAATVAGSPSLSAILPATLPAGNVAGNIVGPTNTQYTAITNDIAAIGTALASIVASANTASAGSGTNGSAVGAAAAAAAIAGRASDNGQAAMTSTLTYTPPAGSGTTAGVYVPPATRPALEPTAGAVTPFVIAPSKVTAAIATVPTPPAITTLAYEKILLGTECVGSSGALTSNVVTACQAAGLKPQTAAQAKAALYWNDPGGTYQPPGHWLQIADAAAASTSLGLLQHAQEDAIVGAAMSDAGAAAWQVKFYGNGSGFAGNLWRPITAIRDCSNWNADFFAAGACDPSWNSLIATPPHPDYLAGHPAFSGAAATALDAFFQADNINFNVTNEAYCNAGSATRDATGAVIACTTDRAYSVSNPSDCNNAGTGAQAPLNQDFTVNTLYNNSPLICAASIAFTGFQDASSGDLGSTFSRIAGGIHTSIAVDQALALGNIIGQAVANDANVPEPGTLALLAVGLAAIGFMRHRGGKEMIGLVR